MTQKQFKELLRSLSDEEIDEATKHIKLNVEEIRKAKVEPIHTWVVRQTEHNS